MESGSGGWEEMNKLNLIFFLFVSQFYGGPRSYLYNSLQ